MTDVDGPVVHSPHRAVTRIDAAAVKARIDIVDVVGEHVRLERIGRLRRGLCPFHEERTPSFHVQQDRQSWCCYGCGERGDVFDFVELLHHTDFRGALELLARRAGIDPEPAIPSAANAPRRARLLEILALAQAHYDRVLWSTPEGEPGRRLLADRGVTEDSARKFGLGYAGGGLLAHLLRTAVVTTDEACAAGLAVPRHGSIIERLRDRVVVPIRGETGEVTAFAGRGAAGVEPKYVNTPATRVFDKSRMLFGIDLARPAIVRRGASVVVEGYFDVLACHGAGVDNAVGLGGTALGSTQASRLAQLGGSAVLFLDGDAAGRAAAARALPVLAAEGLDVRIARLPDGVKDPDDLARRDASAVVVTVGAAPPAWQVLVDDALGPTGPDDAVEQRVAAARRAVAVLRRVPSATEREVRAGEVAARIGVRPAAVLADAAHGRGHVVLGRSGAGVDSGAREPPSVETLRAQLKGQGIPEEPASGPTATAPQAPPRSVLAPRHELVRSLHR